MYSPAAAIVLEILNVEESTTLTVPPDSCMGLTLDSANENGSATVPCGLFGPALSASGSSAQNKPCVTSFEWEVSTYQLGRCKVLQQECERKLRYFCIPRVNCAKTEESKSDQRLEILRQH